MLNGTVETFEIMPVEFQLMSFGEVHTIIEAYKIIKVIGDLKVFNLKEVCSSLGDGGLVPPMDGDPLLLAKGKSAW